MLNEIVVLLIGGLLVANREWWEWRERFWSVLGLSCASYSCLCFRHRHARWRSRTRANDLRSDEHCRPASTKSNAYNCFVIDDRIWELSLSSVLMSHDWKEGGVVSISDVQLKRDYRLLKHIQIQAHNRRGEALNPFSWLDLYRPTISSMTWNRVCTAKFN